MVPNLTAGGTPERRWAYGENRAGSSHAPGTTGNVAWVIVPTITSTVSGSTVIQLMYVLKHLVDGATYVGVDSEASLQIV